MAAASSEMPQRSSICFFFCHSYENLDTLYLKVVGIPSSPKRTITKKINFCKYDKNGAADQYKWEVNYDGGVGTLFVAITDKKGFDDDRENLVSMEGQLQAEVEDQSGKFFPFLNDDSNEMKKYQFYAGILYKRI